MYGPWYLLIFLAADSIRCKSQSLTRPSTTRTVGEGCNFQTLWTLAPFIEPKHSLTHLNLLKGLQGHITSWLDWTHENKRPKAVVPAVCMFSQRKVAQAPTVKIEKHTHTHCSELGKNTLIRTDYGLRWTMHYGTVWNSRNCNCSVIV